MPYTSTRGTLYELVWSEPMQTLASRFSICDRGLAKICIAANIPVPGYSSGSCVLQALAASGEARSQYRSSTIRTMGLLWVGVAIAATVGLVVALMRLASRGGHTSADMDLGSVSEAWLAEHRKGKDS